MTMKHDAALLSSHRTMSLIATYEELYHVPAEEQVTYYFGDLGGHFLKYGVTEDAALAAYDKALAAIRMDSDTFQQTEEFIYRGGIIARMWSCMLDGNASLKDALSCWAEDRDTALLHEDAPDCCVPMEHLTRLTQAGRNDFTALLDAQVEEIRVGFSSIEVVISGVEPEELQRFSEAYDAFIEAERAMGPMM